ncbi:MAG: protein kinase [Polyangia bacterium]
MLLLLGALTACADDPAEDKKRLAVAPYGGSWEYLYGQSPLDDRGVPRWAQPQDHDSAWKPAPAVTNPPGRNRQQNLWLRTRLVGPKLTDPILNLWAVDERCQAFLDGRPIPCFGDFSDRALRRYPGKAQIYLELGRDPDSNVLTDYRGKTLVLRIYSPYYTIGIYGNPSLGERAAVLSSLVQLGLPVFAVGSVLLTLGLAVLGLFLSRRRDTDYLLFGGLSLTVGIYLLSRVHVRSYLLDAPLLWRIAELGSLPIIGSLASLFVGRMLKESPRGILQIEGWLILCYGLLATCLAVLGVLHPETALRGMLVLLILLIASLIGVAAVGAWRGNVEARIFAVGLLVMGMLAGYDILMSLDLLKRRPFLVHYAIGTFVLTLGILMARRFLAIHKRLNDYSSVLQLSFTAVTDTEPGQLAHIALREVVRLLDSARALLFLINPSSGELELSAQHAAPGARSSGEHDRALVDAVMRQGRPLIRPPTAAPAGDTPAPSVLAVPLLAMNRTLGVIYLEAAESRREFVREDAELLAGLGNQVVLTQVIARAVRLEIEGLQAKQRIGEQGELLAAAARLARGDLLTPIQVPPTSTLAMLAQALDEMRQDLLRQIQRLEANNHEIRELNEELRRQIEQRSRRLMEMVLKTEHGARASGAAFTAGQILGEHYRVLRTIGQGTSGQVYEVERTTDGRHLAAKVLTGRADQMAVVRFAREAQLLARVSHPNLVAIMDVDVTPTGVLFIVMERVRGTPLHNLRERYGNLSFALPVLRQIASSLQVIHAQGIVHRDLKPANVVIADEAAGPVAKLLDFGVATLLKAKEVAAAKEPPAGRETPTIKDSSEVGVLVGTPMYLAPELVEGSHLARPSSDIFSFGVIAFELLTAALPFEQPPVVSRYRHEALAVPRLLQVSPELADKFADPGRLRLVEDLVDRCLSEDSGARPTAVQVAEALAGVLRAK